MAVREGQWGVDSTLSVYVLVPASPQNIFTLIERSSDVTLQEKRVCHKSDNES
jgi:hypothetical protein